MSTTPHLVALGEGAFSVSQVCRILQPGMTPRKVHYWLDTQLLGQPLRWGSPGYPTLLSFQQLLQIRTVQHLRDELRFSLPKVRSAFEWILRNLFDEGQHGLRFERAGGHLVVTTSGGDSLTVPGGQGVLDIDVLNTAVTATRIAWEHRAFVIPGKPTLVANARIQAGSPTVRGTRIETSFVAAFATDGEYTDTDVDELCRLYPALDPASVAEAMEFEGVRLAA